MTAPATSEQVASWKSATGALTISSVGEKAGCVSMFGVVDAAAGPLLEETLQRLFDAGVVHSFWDMSELINYHSEIRIRATQVLAKNRRRLLSIQVLTTSRVVEMGAAIANLSLGGMIQIHRTREAFDRGLEQALG